LFKPALPVFLLQYKTFIGTMTVVSMCFMLAGCGNPLLASEYLLMAQIALFFIAAEVTPDCWSGGLRYI